MQVAQRLDVGERRAHGRTRNGRLHARPFERLRHRIESHGAGRHRADPQRHASADAVVVERDLRRGRGEGEVAPACADLVKTHADARIAPARKAHGGKTGGRGQRRHHRSDEEIGGRNFCARGALAIDECRTERDCDQRDLRRGIGIGERAADGSARTDRSVAHKGHHLGEQGHRSANDRVAFEHDPLALVAHEGKIGDAGDVDQPFRPGEPHGHERNEGLSAGDDPRVVTGGEHRASLVEVRGSCIFERGGLHQTALNTLGNLASFC